MFNYANRSRVNNRGGSNRNRGANRFGRGQHFGPKKSALGQDTSIFIKKAITSVLEETNTIRHQFTDFNINPVLKQNIVSRGYITPTPIQDQAIQPILDGLDIIGLANTGTGKTAAFLIPLINKVTLDRNQKVLIIAPTRELALQISEELRNFAQGLQIFSATLIGGANIHRQISDLNRHPNFVIGTPGRLKDLIERRVLNLSTFASIVLDEVDLMVDIGFINDVKYFISLLPTQRQSLFFSATIPPKVSELLQSFVTDPVTVKVSQQPTSENVDQNIVKVVNRSQKVDQLHDLLTQDGFDKVLIFGRTKHGIEKLNKELLTRGFKVDSIHGNKSQGQRQRALDNFKKAHVQVLLATDVASRGLDIDNVTHVINYDLPETYDDYIHRIGRTGRADKKGIALTFVD